MTFLTAKKLQDGTMGLAPINPFSYNSEVEYRRQNNEFNAYDDFEAKNKPLIALFTCNDGETFILGKDVAKVELPSLSGYSTKARRLGIDREFGYQKISQSEKSPYWADYNLPFKELHEGIHNLVQKHGWKDFYMAAKKYNEKVTKSNYKIPTP